MNHFNNVAIIAIVVACIRLLVNVMIWVYCHHTRAGRIWQRVDPPTYRVLPWLFLIGLSIGWLLG